MPCAAAAIFNVPYLYRRRFRVRVERDMQKVLCNFEPRFNWCHSSALCVSRRVWSLGSRRHDACYWLVAPMRVRLMRHRRDFACSDSLLRYCDDDGNHDLEQTITWRSTKPNRTKPNWTKICDADDLACWTRSLRTRTKRKNQVKTVLSSRRVIYLWKHTLHCTAV